MYPTVPTTTPGVVSRVSVWTSLSTGPVGVSWRARPKSRILTCPFVVTNTFSGFRSLWTSSFSWAAARPCAICTACSTALRTGSGPRRSTARSVSPSRSSVTAYAVPASSPKSWRATMFEWLKAATARASRSKRFRRSGSRAKASGRTLTATSRPRRVSRARKTSPMPPAPRGARIS